MDKGYYRAKCCPAWGRRIASWVRKSAQAKLRSLQLVSGDHNSFTYLLQRLLVAMQRGNTASVLGSAGNICSQDFTLRPKLYVLLLRVLYCISYYFLGVSFYVYFQLCAV